MLTLCAAAACNRELRTAAAADSKTIECAHILAHIVCLYCISLLFRVPPLTLCSHCVPLLHFIRDLRTELQRKSEILKRRLESNRIMLKEQTELKEALAQAKEEVLARAKDQATDENKFNELYRQREMELNDLKLELQRYACMFSFSFSSSDSDLCMFLLTVHAMH